METSGREECSYDNSSEPRYSEALLAFKGMVEKKYICQREATPSLFLLWAGVVRCTGTSTGEPETAKQDSQCRNQPDER